MTHVPRVDAYASEWICPWCGIQLELMQSHTCDPNRTWHARAIASEARVKELEDELAEIRKASGALPGVPTYAQVYCANEDNVMNFERVKELEAELAELRKLCVEAAGMLFACGGDQCESLADRLRDALGIKGS